MDYKDIPSEELIYDIGDLGESELVFSLFDKRADIRAAAVIEVAKRLGSEESVPLIKGMIESEKSEYVLDLIYKTLAKL